MATEEVNVSMEATADGEDPLAGMPPRDLSKVLGKAPHPRAINRMVQIWPKAYVNVEHGTTRHDGTDYRYTRVFIYEFDPKTDDDATPTPRLIQGLARCHPSDQFCRRKGIELAFRRALRNLSAVWGSEAEA